jgi:hypothetical protein
MTKPNVLFVGDKDRQEFAEAVDQLDRQANCQWTPDVTSVLVGIDDDVPPPDIVIVAQSRPGQYLASHVDTLRRTFPLTRFVALLGSLCEGEARTGRPWPGTTRIYWHQWAPRFARELDRMATGSCPTWGLPLTATPDEMIEFSCNSAAISRSGLLAIRARLGSTFTGLAAACRSVGYATVWLRDDQQVRVEGSTAVLWDDIHCGAPRAAAIATVAEAVRPAPIIAMLHFPRAGDRDRALAAGAATVLSKPFLLDDLFWHLDRLT